MRSQIGWSNGNLTIDPTLEVVVHRGQIVDLGLGGTKRCLLQKLGCSSLRAPASNISWNGHIHHLISSRGIDQRASRVLAVIVALVEVGIS